MICGFIVVPTKVSCDMVCSNPGGNALGISVQLRLSIQNLKLITGLVRKLSILISDCSVTGPDLIFRGRICKVSRVRLYLAVKMMAALISVMFFMLILG